MGRPPRKIYPVFALVVLVAAWSGGRGDLWRVPRLRVGALDAALPLRPERGGALRLFALGDTGRGDHDQYAVAAAMERRCQEVGGIDGILLLGDNAYPEGLLSVDDPQWQAKVEVPYGSPCLAAASIFPVLGNHDYRVRPVSQIEYSATHPRWHMPNRFYSVDFGDLVSLVALDSNVSDLCGRPDHCGFDFLMDRVAHAKGRFVLIMGHHPIASSSDHGFGYRGGFRGLLLRPYLCNRADLYLSGHSHHMEARTIGDCPLRTTIAGGGGAELYQTIPPDDDVKFLKSVHGFVELEVTPTQLTQRLFGVGGEALFESRQPPRAR